MSTTAAFILLLAGLAGGTTQPANSTIPRFNDGRDWFFQKRLGMFVHWGLYAIPAWHEQDQYRRRVPRREYEKYIGQFNPARFDPNAWLDLAQSAGMQYICLTTKHIDGFCLWDTKQTSYNVMNTPYRKDVLRQLADACHARQFPLCLYYSVVDMHHPNYPNQNRSYELAAPDPGDEPDQARYLGYLREQVRELCTNYGTIHGFWWDGNVMEHRDPSFNALIRTLQPGAVINNRGFDKGDFSTPEREWDNSVNTSVAFTQPTEACQAVGAESWGYRLEEDYHSCEYLIRSIDKVLAKGGNYLLNVGPKADGTIPAEATRILQAIGRWYHPVAESYDGAQPASQLVENRQVLLTRKANTLYVHMNQPPLNAAVSLKPLQIAPRRATLLNDGRAVQTRTDVLPSEHKKGKGWLRLYDLPVDEFAGSVMVVKLEFDALPETVTSEPASR